MIIRYIFSWYLLGFGTCAIVILSILPFEVSEPAFSFADKIFHFLIYAGFSFISVNIFSLKQKKKPRLYSFLYAFSLGLLMEIVQFFLPYRSFEIGDIFSNFLGSAIGCFLRII
ncbi:MAG: VanZ family protein [Candidatus Omnitrophota bacterium]